MNTQLEEEIRQYAKQLNNVEYDILRFNLELMANKIHEEALERIAQKNKLPYHYKNFEEEKYYFVKANSILIQQIENNEIPANSQEEKILLKIVLDIAKENCQTFK